MDYAEMFGEAEVEAASRAAFAVPDVARAVTELTALKGVGPATASAILAAFTPEIAPFMYDEVFAEFDPVPLASASLAQVHAAKTHDDRKVAVKVQHIHLTERVVADIATVDFLGYIRDSAFDPRRWVAPGQISLRPFPCNCGVDLMNVPMERGYITEDSSIVVGKPCDKGHRWMCSKTIANCIEALVGAYYVGGGLSAALSMMCWLGFNVTFTTKLLQDAKFGASHLPYFLKKRRYRGTGIKT